MGCGASVQRDEPGPLPPVSPSVEASLGARLGKGQGSGAGSIRTLSLAEPTASEREAAQKHVSSVVTTLESVSPSRLAPFPWEEQLVESMLVLLQKVGGTKNVTTPPSEVYKFAVQFAARHLDGGATEENRNRVLRRAVAVNKTLATMGMRFFRVMVTPNKPSSMNGAMLKKLLVSKATELGTQLTPAEDKLLAGGGTSSMHSSLLAAGVMGEAERKAREEGESGVSSDSDSESEEDGLDELADAVTVDDLDSAFAF